MELEQPYPELQFQMQAKARDNHRAAIKVVGGVTHVLQIRRNEHAPPEVRGIVGFQDVLPAIGKGTIADDETQASVSEVVLVGTRDGVGGEGHTGAWPLPSVRDRKRCCDGWCACS